jgi:hypothetical protein
MRSYLILAALLAVAAPALAAKDKKEANAVYVIMAKGASFDPAKDGKLTLTGVSSSLAGIAKGDDDQIASRIATADAFGSKNSLPIFAGGADVIVEGKTADGDKRLLLNVTNPKFNAATNELVFSPAAVVKTAALQGLVDNAPAVTPANKTIDGTKAAKMDDTVVFVDAYAPHIKAAVKRQKAKAAGGAAAAPAPAMAADAPAPAAAEPADGAPVPKPGPKKPPPKPAAPQSRRRNLLQGCTAGYCMYVNKAGACVQAPSSCDGVPGETGESWGCPQCQYFQMVRFCFFEFVLHIYRGGCCPATGLHASCVERLPVFFFVAPNLATHHHAHEIPSGRLLGP